MIPKSCLTKLGDHRNNEIAEKQKCDALFMVAWRELLEIINFIDNNSEKVDEHTSSQTQSNPKKSVHRDSEQRGKDAIRLVTPCHVVLRRLTNDRLELTRLTTTKDKMTADSKKLSVPTAAIKPCQVVLRRLTNEQLELTGPTTTKDRMTADSKNPSVPDTAINTLTREPLKVKKTINIDKKANCDPPIQMITRNRKKEMNKRERNKENE